MRYDTLRQLSDAIAAGTVKDAVLMLDNDSTSVYEDAECVFEMHPDDLLEQALDLLGIPHEHV
jgi:hypothetical protein